MGKMLLEAGLVNDKTKGILVEACNFGLSTFGGNLNGQEMSNITGKNVMAAKDYIYYEGN